MVTEEMKTTILKHSKMHLKSTLYGRPSENITWFDFLCCQDSSISMWRWTKSRSICIVGVHAHLWAHKTAVKTNLTQRNKTRRRLHPRQKQMASPYFPSSVIQYAAQSMSGIWERSLMEINSCTGNDWRQQPSPDYCSPLLAYCRTWGGGQKSFFRQRGNKDYETCM